jgi:NDP-sugar pyrophosphorylase family protein
MSTTKPVLIILAGGASSRMWPLREKSLIRFGDDPLLVMQLRHYQTLGFERAVIVGNPQNYEDIRSMLSGLTLHIDLVIQQAPNGMGDALLQAEAALQDIPNTPIYVNQVHDVVDESLHVAMLNAYKQTQDTTYLAGVEMTQYFPGGYLIVDESGQITGIVEKPGAGNEPSNLVNIVAHIHRNAAELFDALRVEYASDNASDDHYERAMDTLMKQFTYRVVPYSGSWNALKYPWHVLDIMNHYLNQIEGQTIADDVYIAPTASIVGNVIIRSGAKIFPGAAVVGPAYIGAGVIVGNNSLVRNSMVMDKCEVGFTTEVARSYVSSRCGMHACRVLDSIFAEGVNFSAGSTTANWRIDKGNISSTIKGQRIDSGRDKFGAVIGQNTFLAVDTMTMPGIKIGENVQIGPGTHVIQDVRDNVRVYVKQTQEIIEHDA